MKILHCCLAQFYVDDYGYQENVLPRMHQLQGHDVTILASTETFKNNIRLGYLKPSLYTTKDGIPVKRIPYVWWLPHSIAKKLRIYPDIFEFLSNLRPDVIFIHDVQFLSILQIRKYAQLHGNVRIYVDGHADYINSARNWLSKHVLHQVIYRFCAQSILPFTKKFYGVLPARVDFFKEIYKIPEDKVELLVMGGDLTEIDFDQKSSIKDLIRARHQIDSDDFVIITGGKIDSQKNTKLLIQAVHDIQNPKIKLIVFGKINDDYLDSLNFSLNSPNIRYVGWLSQKWISNYFLASNLAFFPGTHSTLWEHSAAIGLPGVFKKFPGMQHIDIGGNVIFLSEISVESIKEVINRLYSNKKLFKKMENVAISIGVQYFSYYDIAKRSIED